MSEHINPLFRDRVPEAAAVQVALVLAWLAECELATLEYYRCTKSAPKHELKRHESICKTLISHCKDLNVPPRGFWGDKCPRLAEALNEACHETAKPVEPQSRATTK